MGVASSESDVTRIRVSVAIRTRTVSEDQENENEEIEEAEEVLSHLSEETAALPDRGPRRQPPRRVRFDDQDFPTLGGVGVEIHNQVPECENQSRQI